MVSWLDDKDKQYGIWGGNHMFKSYRVYIYKFILCMCNLTIRNEFFLLYLKVELVQSLRIDIILLISVDILLLLFWN